MQSLRTYLEKLEATLPGQLVKVQEPVDWMYGITARVTQAEKAPGNPALLLENIKGYKMPVLVNLFGSTDRIHHALKDAEPGRGRLAFYGDWNRLFNKEAQPTHVKTGPVKEVIHKDSEVNLENLPIPWFYPKDERASEPGRPMDKDGGPWGIRSEYESPPGYYRRARIRK